MKKRISMLLIAALTCSMLASCAGKEDSASAPGGDTVQNTESGGKESSEQNAAQEGKVDGTKADISTVTAKGPERISQDGTELTIWVRSQTECVTDYDNNLMTRWYEDKTGVHVNWITVPSESFSDQFNTSIASGQYPDIYNSYLTSTEMTLYGGENGIFYPIDDLIDQGWMPNLKAYLEENPDFESLRSPDGKLYGIPTTTVAPHMLFTNKVFVNKEWLQKYVDDGGKKPETTEEFEDMLVYFKEHDMNGNGELDEIPMSGCQPSGWGTDPTIWMLNPFILSIGSGNAQFLTADEDGNVTWVGGTDAYREGLRWAHSLVERGLLDEATYTQDQGMYRSLVTDNLVGVAAGAEESQFTDEAYYDNWEALAPLQGPAGVRQAPVYSTKFSDMSYSCVITRSCKDPEAAAKWLDYFFSDEGSVVAADGFENYNLTYSDTPALDGSVPSIVRIADSDANLNTRWGNKVAPFKDVSQKENDAEGTNRRLIEAADIYAPYLTETGIPLIGWPLSTDEEARYSEVFNWVVLETYYKSFKFITGRKDSDIAGGGQTDINNDQQWETYLKHIQKDNALEDYIRLCKKKYLGITE